MCQKEQSNADRTSAYTLIEENQRLHKLLDNAVALLGALRDPQIDETGAEWIDSFMQEYEAVLSSLRDSNGPVTLLDSDAALVHT